MTLILPWLHDVPFICSFLMGFIPLPCYSVETLSTVSVYRWNKMVKKCELGFFSLLKVWYPRKHVRYFTDWVPALISA